MKKKNLCPGGTEHPTREDMKCWGNHEHHEAHWSMTQTRDGLRRITWRD